MVKVSRRSVLRHMIAVPAVVGLASAAQGQVSTAQSRTLVAYFSRTGNTRVIAGQLRRARQADIFEIQPAKPYPEDYAQTVSQAQWETEAGFEPALAQTIPDMTAYNTVYLGL